MNSAMLQVMLIPLFIFPLSDSAGADEVPINITAEKTYSVNSTGKVETYGNSKDISALVFQGSVVVVQGDLKITGDRAKAHLLGSDRPTIGEIDITGAPARFRIENWLERAEGRSEKVRFDVREGVIHLEGDAHLIKDGEESSGGRLSYELQLIKVEK